MKKIKYSWEDIYSCTNDIINFANNVGIDTIVGIARGGLPIAVIISNQLDCQMFTIGIRSYNNDMTRAHIKTTQDLDAGLLNDDNRVLIVDDICDSGKSLQYVKDKLDTNCKVDKVFTSSVFFRQGSLFMPDIYSETILDDSWVEFPWG